MANFEPLNLHTLKIDQKIDPVTNVGLEKFLRIYGQNYLSWYKKFSVSSRSYQQLPLFSPTVFFFIIAERGNGMIDSCVRDKNRHMGQRVSARRLPNFSRLGKE